MSAWAMQELERRLANLIRIGTVEQLDAANHAVRVRTGDTLTTWLQWITQRAQNDRSWWAPEPGEQVVILSPSGELAQGVVLPSLFQASQPPPASQETVQAIEYADGTRQQHDRASSSYSLTVPAGGSITLQVGGTSLVLEDGNATLTTQQVTIDAQNTTNTGNERVEGLLTYLSGLAGSNSGSGATAAIVGNLQVLQGDITADDISLKSHTHREQGDGEDTSAAQ